MNISIKIILHIEKTSHVNNCNMVSYLSCNLENWMKGNIDFFIVSSIMGIDGTIHILWNNPHLLLTSYHLNNCY